MADIVEFLRARLEEDEQTAREAVCTPDETWVASYHKVRTTDRVPIAECGMAQLERADHIARWDPARVLAEVEARKALLELHERADYRLLGDILTGSSERGPVCTFCTSSSWGERWPCEHLRLLALPYQGHPDFDSRWKP